MTDKDKMPLNRRERTRERLIRAADRLIWTRGYDALAMEDVADAAGVTRRTIYDHFRDRHDLIIAVIYSRPSQLVVPVKPGQTLKDYLRAVAVAVVKSSQDRPTLGRSAAYLQLYVLADEETRLKAVERNRAIYDKAEAGLVTAFGPDAFGMAPGKFVRVLHGMVEGFIMRRQLMPEEFSAEVIYAAFDALNGASYRNGSTRKLKSSG
jgi:AcrR family transcriptional regulator